MKKIIVIYLFNLTCFAQILNGKISYTVKVGTDALFENIESSLRSEYILEKESECYDLLFDRYSSIFIFKGGLTLTDNNKSERIYYKDTDSAFTLRPSLDPDFGKIIIKENRNIKWTLTNEIKYIDNYKCIKATATIAKDLGNKKTTKFPLIAWYCPEIPIATGPLGYGGLPGLILELQERIITYGAKSISFNLKDFVPSQKPIDGKLITQEELNIKIRNLYFSK